MEVDDLRSTVLWTAVPTRRGALWPRWTKLRWRELRWTERWQEGWATARRMERGTERRAASPRGGPLLLGGRLGLMSVLLVGLMSGLMGALGLGGPAAAEELVEAVAAQVGTEIVLDSEVRELAEPLEERLRQSGAPTSEIQRIRHQALQRLIESRLLSSVVDRLELGATREEVDEAIAGIAAENGISLDQLYASIASHGLSVDEYRTKIQGEIERSKVVNAMVRSRVEISKDEVQALYEDRFGDQRSGGEEIHVRHLVVLTEGGPVPRTPALACETAAEARRRIVAGELDFSSAAQRVSDANAERGGDLGWIHRADLASWMARRVDEMKPGEVSPVIEMPFGCNLLELVDRRDFQPVGFEQAAPQIRAMLFQRKTESEYVKWLDVLRKQTYIELKGPYAGGSIDG